MSGVIRVSEQTYNRLESLARGFDTPGNVIDRLLDFYDQHHENILLPEEGELRGENRVPIKRIRGAIPQREYRIPILEALVEKGGKAKQKEVFDIIEQKMERRFEKNSLDIAILRDGYTKRWQKNVAFQRFRMVREGFLKSDSSRGDWEITEKGRKFLKDRLSFLTQPKQDDSSISQKSQPAGTRRLLGRRGFDQLKDYLIPVIRLIKSGIKHPDAFRRIADNLGVTKQTAQAECTVQLDHISTDKFVELINSDKIKSFLKERFPDKTSLIDKEI